MDQGARADDPHSLYDVRPSAAAQPIEPLDTAGYRPAAGVVSHRGWLALCRPRTLLVGSLPALVTLALLAAHGVPLYVLPALSTLLAVALVLAGANMLDEYLDYMRALAHAGASAHIDSGYRMGNRLKNASVRPLTALRLSIALLLIGTLAGVPAARSGGTPLIVLGAIGLLAAFLYSSTTYALKRLPLGELALALAIGPGVTTATALAQGQRLSVPVALLGAGFGLLTLALAQAAHLRDAEVDRAYGRRTLAVLAGARFVRTLYAACLLGGLALIVLIGLMRGGAPGFVAAVLALPAALLALTGVIRASAPNARDLAVRLSVRAYLWIGTLALLGLLLRAVIAAALPLLRDFLG
jgi:1,4-dihydroxy-2-naphthoate polyprenyltransferase